jgi:hypothetical protein
VSAESDDLELSHARGHFKILRSTGVVERFMVWKRVSRAADRHDTVAGVAGAPCEHNDCNACV